MLLQFLIVQITAMTLHTASMMVQIVPIIPMVTAPFRTKVRAEEQIRNVSLSRQPHHKDRFRGIEPLKHPRLQYKSTFALNIILHLTCFVKCFFAFIVLEKQISYRVRLNSFRPHPDISRRLVVLRSNFFPLEGEGLVQAPHIVR